MSRTFRRKGYEKTQGSSWAHRGDKVAGYYTQSSREWEVNFGFWVYREPTRQEYYSKYWRIHGDNHTNEYTPNKWYRKFRMRQNRQINRGELYKYMTRIDYEPLTQAEPISHWWDWR